MYFALRPNSTSEAIEVLGYSLTDRFAVAERANGVAWSERGLNCLKAIMSIASTAGDGAGLRLPYASLRALIAATLPNPILVTSDLSLLWPKASSERSFIPNFAEADAPAGDCQRAVNSAARRWVSEVLSGWADARGVPAALVAEISSLAISNELTVAKTRPVDISQTGARDPYADIRDAVHSKLFQSLAGEELFQELGPARSLIRSWSRDNTISFLTYPKRVEGNSKGSFSMRARLSVETFPGQELPFVRLDVSRVRWCPQVPTAFMPRQRKITSTIFGADEHRAVSFEVPLSKGKVQDPEDPAYATMALRSGIDPGQSFGSLIEAGPHDGAFVGIPFAPAYEPAPAIATGATELDWLDCFDRILERANGVLVPLEAESIPASKRIARKKSDIPAVKATQILEEIALNLGHNDIDNAAIGDAWEVLYGDQPPAGVEIGVKAAEARARFEGLREGNSERLRRTFGEKVPTIVVLSASAKEGSAIAEVAKRLFAGSIKIETRLLPVGVHGPRKELPAADERSQARYEARIQAWRPLAEKLLHDFGPTRALVHASRFRDDGVNKIAGRVALARFGDCNVQYLDGRGSNANDWFFRIQAAVLDLMFGHSGLVSPVAENIEQAFPDPANRPKSIIGISVVSQNRTYSRSSASFFLSVSIDVASGRTLASAACPKDGDLEFKGPLPFFELLKAVAGWQGANIGSTETAKSAFQQFVSDIVGTACDRGERPIVMFDGAHARGLWSAVSNAGWGQPMKIDGRTLDVDREWPGVRLVRIQDTIEPIVLTRKSRQFLPLGEAADVLGDEFTSSVPTLTDAGRLVRLKGSAPNYISSGDLDGQQKIAKGLSVYRSQPAFKKVKEAEPPEGLSGWDVFTEAPRDLTNEPYKLAGVIGIHVLHNQPGDDADRIAALCHGLRNGFGHTRSPTRYPAPLFHTRKVAEYIPAYVLDDDDLEEVPTDDDLSSDEVEDDSAQAKNEETSVASTNTAASVQKARLPTWYSTTSDLKRSTSSKTTPFPFKSENPLLALAEGSRISFDRPNLQVVPRVLPALSSSAARNDNTSLPEHLRGRAKGDEELLSLMDMCWVGPLPSFMDQEWMMSLLGANVSFKTRQQIQEAIKKTTLPGMRFLPEYDGISDESLAEILLGLMCIGDGLHFLRFTINRQFTKHHRRWIFNSIYDQFHRQVRMIRRTDPTTSMMNALSNGSFTLAKQLHDAGHFDLLRQFLVIEPIFLGKNSAAFAETTARLEKEVGSEYAEIAAFCARLARYQLNNSATRAASRQWAAKQDSLKAPRKLGIADMLDVDDVAELETVPDTSAPAIDTAFLRDKLALSGAFRSHLHGHRDLIRSAIGDNAAWPDEKPSAEQITACIARLFSAPVPLLAAICERDKESLFRPFYRKIETAVRTINEGRAPHDRLELMSPWTTNGFAPAVVYFLSARGYKAYASELAYIRAIENPSLSLEQTVAAGGEEFADAARFVRARRQATLWFYSNDDRSDGEMYAAYLKAFEEGEIMVIDQDQEAEPVEADVVVGSDDPLPPQAAETESEAPELKLDRALGTLVRLAESGREAYALGDLDALERLATEMSGLTADITAAVGNLTRKVSNSDLVSRAFAIRSELELLATKLRSELALGDAPVPGEIDPARAEQAKIRFASIDATVARVRNAFRDAEGLRAKATEVDVVDALNLMEQVRQRIDAAKADLPEAIAAFNDAIRLIEPEATTASEVEAAIETVTGENPTIEIGTVLEHPSAVPEAAIPVLPTENPDDLESPWLVTPPELVLAFNDEDIEDLPLEDFDLAEIEGIAFADETHTLPLAGPIQEEGPVTDQLDEQFDEFAKQDVTRIETALQAFAAGGSFGLAYHLARAAELVVTA